MTSPAESTVATATPTATRPALTGMRFAIPEVAFDLGGRPVNVAAR